MLTWSLPSAVRKRLQGHLQADERLLWAGRPDRRRPHPWGRTLVLLGVLWMLVLLTSSFFFLGRLSDGSSQLEFSHLFTMAGATVAGMMLLTSPLWLRGFDEQITCAVTSHRALVMVEARGHAPHIVSYEPDAVRYRQLVTGRDGRGDLIFGPPSSGEGRGRYPGFESVRDAELVDRLLGETFP